MDVKRAENRIRTDDPRITNALLYQLSYPGKERFNPYIFKGSVFGQISNQEEVGYLRFGSPLRLFTIHATATIITAPTATGQNTYQYPN